jgi:hypothetical protein
MLLLLLLGSVIHGFWTLRIGQSLVCPEEIAPSDIVLVENFDPDYLVFERAAALQRAGVASRVFVPVPASRDPARPNPMSQGIAEVMARGTRMPDQSSFQSETLSPSVSMSPIRSGTF